MTFASDRKLIIPRSHWLRGKKSVLCDRYSRYCFLGWIAASCGVPREALIERRMPWELPVQYQLCFPVFFYDPYLGWSRLTWQAIKINDDAGICDGTRERRLIKLLRPYRIAVQFADAGQRRT